MDKVDFYKNILSNLSDWDRYLLTESGLPGPRANLELLEAVAEVGNEVSFNRYLCYDIVKAPTGSTEEFFAMCGVVGLGKLITEGKNELLSHLRPVATDKRWRIRESVAIALQRLGLSDMDFLIKEMEAWSQGNLLEKRAVVAALCEPKLLKDNDAVLKVLTLLDQITKDLLNVTNRKDENFKTLRKTLGYGWSVAVVAGHEEGKCLMEKWFSHEDTDIRWIMKENLRKNLLNKMDKDWATKWKQELGVS